MLDICKHFFEHLNEKGIRYCHWKSNEHLDAALAGKTDLDVLVHIDDKSKLQAAFDRYDFKKIISPPEKQFPGMADYLGFDQNTGSFIHFHLHHYLVLGQKYIKNHHLPLEDFVLNNLTMKDNVRIPCPEIELMLLIIRAHMKTDIISLLKHAIKDRTSGFYTAFPNDIENEFFELISQSDLSKFKEFLKQSQLPLDERIFTHFIEIYKAKKLTANDILKTQIAILSGLKSYRRNKSPLIYWQYFLFFVAELPIIRNLKTYKRKTMNGPGKIFSIVGSDGSGKSTLIADLQKWLSWKLFVKQYYYGIPKGPRNTLTFNLKRVLRKLGLDNVDQWIEANFWMHVARTRQAINIRSHKDANAGLVVITDRYPLKDFHDMAEPMDGPRLGKSIHFAGSTLAEQEAEIYQNIELPDRIYVLQVEIDELRKRKTDLSLEAHKIKALAVNNLKGGGAVELIDANRPYDEVLLDIKRRIWATL